MRWAGEQVAGKVVTDSRPGRLVLQAVRPPGSLHAPEALPSSVQGSRVVDAAAVASDDVVHARLGTQDARRSQAGLCRTGKGGWLSWCA